MDKEKAKVLNYEVVLNTGGDAVLSSRVSEEKAGRVAMALGMEWPSECVIRWPLVIRKVGVRPEIEGRALEAALREIVEIPDGELVIWVAGKKGALGAEVNGPGDDGETPKVLDAAAMLDTVARIVGEAKAGGDRWGWIVKTAKAGDVLAK